MSFKIYKDTQVNNIIIENKQILPLINSNALPSPIINGIGAAIAFDVVTRRVYFCDGEQWLPINSGSSSRNIETFSHFKAISQIIPPNTSTLLSSWTIATSPALSTISGWNLSTGIYTAQNIEKINITAILTWLEGFSNVGIRILKLQFLDNSTSITSTIQKSEVQASSDQDNPTVCNLSFTALLNPGDQLWLEAEHNAPIPINDAINENTTICGFRTIL